MMPSQRWGEGAGAGPVTPGWQTDAIGRLAIPARQPAQSAVSQFSRLVGLAELVFVDGRPFEGVIGPWYRFGDCVALIPPGRTEGASAGAQASPEPLLSCGIFWSGHYLQEEQCFTRTRVCASPNSRPMRGTCS